MDSSEDEAGGSEQGEANASDEALNMKLEDDCVGEKIYKGKEHVMTSEEEDVIPAVLGERTTPPPICVSASGNTAPAPVTSAGNITPPPPANTICLGICII